MQLERNRSWNFAAVVEEDFDTFTVSVGSTVTTCVDICVVPVGR